MTDLEAARDEIRAARPAGWFVGPPTYVEHRNAWEQYLRPPRSEGRSARPTVIKPIRSMVGAERFERSTS